MANVIQTFPQIQSLEAIYAHLNTPFSEGEWGILALDFDQTLVQAKPTIGDEHFYRFLSNQNKSKGINSDAHYHWTVKVRANIKYETCEPVDRINQIVSDFRNGGWTVKILTSRGVDMREITEAHLKMTGLAFSINDVIFKEFNPDGSGKLFRKNQSLVRWMRCEPQWETCKKVRVFFLDDSTSYCNEVAQVSTEVKNATVTCFHYIRALPNPELSQAQLEQLVVQLHAYKEQKPIPYGLLDPDQLRKAMQDLEIQEIKPSTIYETIRTVAALDNTPF